MHVEQKQVGEVSVLIPHGRIDQTSASDVEQSLAPWLTVALEQQHHVVLDLSQVPYVSSAGLRILMLMSRQLREKNRQLIVAALQTFVQEVFDISRFNMVVPVQADVAQALRVLGEAS